MKKITVSILSVLMMLSMVFSSSVFAAEKEVSAWDAFLGLFGAQTSDVSDVGVEYRGHVQNKGDFPLDGTWIQGPDQLGTVGEGLRLEAFWIKLAEDAPAGLHIKYQVHVQNKGWMGFVEDGTMAGTEGEGLRIEAIQISLVDDEGNIADGYSVEYRGHVQNVGDTEWYADGAQLGTTGSGLRLEALEIKIVQTKADLTAYNAAVAAAAALTEADYTAESWAALQTALTDNVVTEDNTQAEVDAATAAINAAIDALEMKLEVVSVAAINGKQVTVTFNKAVDTLDLGKANFVVTQEADASGTDRITDSASATNKATGTQVVNTGVVEVSGDTATLTMDTNAIFTNGKTITIKTTGVVDGADTMADVTKTAFLSDTTVPTIVSAASTGSRTFEVVFSEPVYDGATDAYATNLTAVAVTSNVALNDYGVAVSNIQKTSSNPNALVVTTTADLVEGAEYTLKVNPVAGGLIQDYAGYEVIANSSITFTHTIASDLPVVTVAEARTEKVVRLTFDRSVTIPGSSNIEFRYAFNATGAVKTTAATGVAVVANTNNTEWDVTLPSAMNPGTATMYIHYVAAADANKTNVIKDAYGNVMANDAMVSFDVVQDTTAPTAVVAYNSATTLDVTFSKTVTGATNSANYELKDPNGNVVAISGIVQQTPTTDNKYRLTVASMAAGGSYTLAITDGIKDTTVYQTAFVPTTYTVAVTDTKAPTVVDVVANNGTVANGDILYAYFSETMGSSATDASNYRLWDGTTQYTLPTGTVLTQSGTTVKIALPKTLAATATDLGSNTITHLYVGAAKDLAGNTVNPMGNSTINATAPFTATITKTKVLADTQISFVVDRQLKSVDASLINNGTVAATSASFVNNSDGTATVTAYFPAGSYSTFIPATEETVETTATGAFTDLNDIQSATVSTPVDITIDRAAPKYVASTPIVTAGSAGHVTGITVTYSENIYAASVAQSDYTVDGYTITGVSVSSNVVTVSVAQKSGYDSGATPNVTQIGEVEDAIAITADQPTRNVLGAQAVMAATDKVAPVKVSAVENSTTQVTINFSEALDPATVIVANLGGTAVPSAVTMNADNTAAIVTVGTMSGTETITISTSVKDANSNAIAATTLTRGTDF